MNRRDKRYREIDDARPRFDKLSVTKKQAYGYSAARGFAIKPSHR